MMRPISCTAWGMMAAVLAVAGAPAHGAINVRTDLVELGIAARNAAGDGETDDAPVIQALADWIADRGGSVVFPPGTYRFDQTVSFQQNPGEALKLIGRNATITGEAQTLVKVTGERAWHGALRRPAGAFDDVLKLEDATGLDPDKRVGVISRRSSDPPFHLDDNSGGVEHLMRIASVDAETNTVQLTRSLPWHQKASNNVFKQAAQYGYYPFTMSGFEFRYESEDQSVMMISRMKDVTLRDLMVHYTGDQRDPGGNGIQFRNTHDVRCVNVDFSRVMYSLWPRARNSYHTYVGCDGDRTRHTFVLSDMTHVTIRDSNGRDCVSHLDTHRGVNHLTVENVVSAGDTGGFRNIAGAVTMRNCVFRGFEGVAVNIGTGGERAQSATYVLRLKGEQLNKLAIDDVLRFDGNRNMTAAVVSFIERGEKACTVIAYQLRGRGYNEGGAETDLGARFSGRGWPFRVVDRNGVSGQVTDHEYVQVALGHSVIEDAYFEASNSSEPTISIGNRYAATVRDTVIVRPKTGIQLGGAAVFWTDETELEGVRVVSPRNTAFKVRNFIDVTLRGCEVRGFGRRGTGITPQGGMSSVLRLQRCRFTGLQTAVDYTGSVRARDVRVRDCERGFVLRNRRKQSVRFSNVRVDAETPFVRDNMRGPLVVSERVGGDVAPGDFTPRPRDYEAFLNTKTNRLMFWTPEQWLNEAGKPIKANPDDES